MLLVARKKDKEAKEPNLVMTFRCDAELRRAMDKFQEAQRIKPTKAEILIVALQEFLQREGYYPPE